MSLAMKYNMKKKMGKACKGADCPGCATCSMAEGGEVKEEMESGYQEMPDPEAEDDSGEEGIVDRIMKRFAKGGEVKGEEPVADFEENDFDVLPGMEDTEADETGANSGDEIGDEAEDEDRKDIVSRIMKSRGKKDRMPRPA